MKGFDIQNCLHNWNITRSMDVGNHFPLYTWGFLSLDKTKFNGKLLRAFLYVIIGCITGWLINLYDKFNRIKLFCFLSYISIF